MAGSLKEAPSTTVYFGAWFLGTKYRAGLTTSPSFANGD